MIINCCSRAVLEYEIKNRIRHLEKDKEIQFKIYPSEILSGTFDLIILNSQKEQKEKRK